MKVVIIGVGNMGGFIVCGLVKGKLILVFDIIVFNFSIGKLEVLKKEFFFIVIICNNVEVVIGVDIVILVVKFWLIRGVF